MDQEQREEIIDIIKLFPALETKAENKIIREHPLNALTYNEANAQKTNGFHSRVEDLATDESVGELSDEVEKLLKRVRIINNAIESLTEEEQNMLDERFWEDHTLEQMAKGQYNVYDRRTIRSKIDKIIMKLKRAGILESKKVTL